MNRVFPEPHYLVASSSQSANAARVIAVHAALDGRFPPARAGRESGGRGAWRGRQGSSVRDPHTHVRRPEPGALRTAAGPSNAFFSSF